MLSSWEKVTYPGTGVLRQPPPPPVPALGALLSTERGPRHLPTQGLRAVQVLALHVHVHQVGLGRAGTAVPGPQGAVAAAARGGAQGPRQRAQLPGVGPDPGRRGPGPGRKLQRLGSLHGARKAVEFRVRGQGDGGWGSGSFAPLDHREDGGGVREAGDVQSLVCTWKRGG